MSLDLIIGKEEDKITKKKVVGESVLSLAVPFYNIYLFNRAENNLGYNRKKFKHKTNFALATFEAGLIASMYSLGDGDLNTINTIGLMSGFISRAGGITWGCQREYNQHKKIYLD